MDLNQFLTERRERWNRLATLVERIDRTGMEGMSARETDEFFTLYRLVSSDLNLVQTRTGNPAVLEYLEGLVGRAYARLAIPRRVRPFRAWWQIIRHWFPAILRAERRLLALSAAAMTAGAIFGYAATWMVPETARAILPRTHLTESPSERVAGLEEAEAKGKSQVESGQAHSAFTSFLSTHNIRVTAFGFALGFTFGVGTMVILFYNGAMLGSIAARYFDDGVGTFFVAWVGPHGALELPAVVIGCMAGLMLARAQYRRDAGTLKAQLRAMRPSLVDILVGTATLLVVAAAIEGGFSQINEPTLPYALKIAVAATLFVALLAYLWVMPVRPPEEGRGLPGEELD